MAKPLKLFEEFEPVSREAWKEKAISDLKGEDFDRKLVWKTDENILIQPFYTKEDLNEIELEKFQLPGKERKWSNFVQINVADPVQSNQLARKMLDFDANGFLFKVDQVDKVDFGLLLKDLDPSLVKIAFQLSYPSPSFVRNYFDYLKSQDISLEKISGFIETDILGEWSVSGQNADFDELARQVQLTSEAKDFRGLIFNSHSFVNSGSGIIQELAFTLNKVVAILDQLSERGLYIKDLLPELGFHLAIGGDYFFEIAKLKAFRKLASAILTQYDGEPPHIHILSSNSDWSKTLYDPNVNMLRNTTESMSAILGGCDALLIQPHDSSYRDPDKFSYRVALNISNILKEESYFDKVVDPSAGSYYIENLTREIAENALKLFQEIEAKGGYIQAFKDETIQKLIGELSSKKQTDISTRKRVYVGTNKYPDPEEKISYKNDLNIDDQNTDIQLLKSNRSTESFERLRQRTQQHFEKVGSLPKVYLACFGNLAMRKARASFSSEFFGTAGFEILGEFYDEDTERCAIKSAESDADIVVICSSDPDYHERAKQFIETFRKNSANKKLILAGYPADLVDELLKSGLDSFIHMKTDVVEFISGLQNELLGTIN